MNDPRRAGPSSKPPAPKPQWMTAEDQPVVGRIVAVGKPHDDGVDSNAPSSSGAPSKPTAESLNAPAVRNHSVPGDLVYGDSADEPLGKIGRSKLAILTTVFLVAGVLGVPLILYSPVFSTFEKIFWSVAAAIYSATLLYILYVVIVWAQSRL